MNIEEVIDKIEQSLLTDKEIMNMCQSVEDGIPLLDGDMLTGLKFQRDRSQDIIDELRKTLNPKSIGIIKTLKRIEEAREQLNKVREELSDMNDKLRETYYRLEQQKL